jgi:hypothetical protein
VQWLNATAPSGEYLDVLSGEAWRWLRDPVREALHGAAPRRRPVRSLTSAPAAAWLPASRPRSGYLIPIA